MQELRERERERERATTLRNSNQAKQLALLNVFWTSTNHKNI